MQTLSVVAAVVGHLCAAVDAGRVDAAGAVALVLDADPIGCGSAAFLEKIDHGIVIGAVSLVAAALAFKDRHVGGDLRAIYCQGGHDCRESDQTSERHHDDNNF